MLEDPVSGQVYLYSKFTFEPLYGEEMASGIERSASLSPMGLALKVLGNAAVDALLQTLEIRLTQENINRWEDAFYAINKSQVLYSGFSSLIPWKNGVLGTIGQAIVNALRVVISNASKNPNYYVLAATMPFAMVPIQEVPLLSWAVAHESVNAAYGLTASNEDTYIIGCL